MKKKIVELGTLTVLASAALSDAEIITIQPTDDAFLSSAQGEADLPWNYDEITQFGYHGAVKRPLLKFDLSAVPDDAELISATLTLSHTSWYGYGSLDTSARRMVNDDWFEETVTWNSFDQTGDISIAVTNPPTEYGAISWNIAIAEWNYAEDLADDAITIMIRFEDTNHGSEADDIYKFNIYSSKEWSAPPTLQLVFNHATACPGDVNGDGLVDPLDAGYVLSRLGCATSEGDPLCDAADANLDALVDPLDVGYVLSRFGACE